MKSNIKYRLELFLTMTVFGTVGVLRKHLPLPSGVVALLRAFIGAAFLLITAKIKKIKIDRKKIKNNLLPLLLSGVCLGFNWVLLFESYNYISVAVATLCYYFSPAIVIAVSPFVFKEKMNLRKIFCLLAIVAGTVLISGVTKNQKQVENLTGVLLALGAACLYAALTVINKKIENVGTNEKTLFQLGTACVLLFPYCIFSCDVENLTVTPQIVLLVAILGIVHTGIAYMSYFSSMSHLNAQTVALYSYIDPICSVFCSAVILGEGLSAEIVVGSVIILVSSYLSEKA